MPPRKNDAQSVGSTYSSVVKWGALSGVIRRPRVFAHFFRVRKLWARRREWRLCSRCLRPLSLPFAAPGVVSERFIGIYTALSISKRWDFLLEYSPKRNRNRKWNWPRNRTETDMKTRAEINTETKTESQTETDTINQTIVILRFF